MAIFIYTGEPTAGQSTKDIKVKSTSGFTVYTNITPNVTEINTTDAVEIAYFQKYPETYNQTS